MGCMGTPNTKNKDLRPELPHDLGRGSYLGGFGATKIHLLNYRVL